MGVHGPLTDEQRDDIERTRRSERHLLGLINEVLNYTRLEAGAVSYDCVAVPLDEVIATCDALTAPQRAAKKLSFSIDGCTPDLLVHADRERLQQVLLNLLSNAIKFTTAGGRITVDVVAVDDRVEVAVTDTGRGIAIEELGRIFEPFVQVDARYTRTHDGVGLGLAISRDLARGMGGDLTVASMPGVGSTFTLTLVRSPADRVAQSEADPVSST
jgi:signal transduction histidine kinase